MPKPVALVVEMDDKPLSDRNQGDLQGVFLRFRKQRQAAIREQQLRDKAKAVSLQTPKTREEKDALRADFVAQIKKYAGVPYHRKYHGPDSPFHNAPLYLDCCGLIRRAQRDLRERFGFSLAGWNQGYQFDTLPVELTEDEMKPGDLVFYSATYYPEKRMRVQKHDMVHVEVYLGDGKTIGARKQKGVVQEFESYKFVSKSYYDIKFHFRSIETWLDGVCESVCDVHPWKVTKWEPGSKSIFGMDDDDEEEAQGEID